MTRLAKGKASKPKKSGRKRFSVGKLMIAMGITAALAIVCALIGYMVIIYNGQKIYDVNKDKLEMMEASIIYDQNDREVAVLARENRELLEPGQIPRKVSNAFIATEDRRFEDHAGVDLWAIGRALVKDIVARSAVEGGSTITQQLAKNMFLNADKTFFRKGTEMSIALALEENMTKEEILTMYLNRIYFGSGAYGIKAASKVYFGESDISKLDYWQIATLAAIPKAPATYSPLRNPDRSKERRNVVLKLMFDQGYITEDEKIKGQAAEFVPQPSKNQELIAFTDYVVQEAEDVYKLEEEVIRRGGYKIYTTMNVDAQRILEQSFANPKLFQKDGPEQKMQGSMVIVNNKDGGIVAMSGGRDYVNKGLNRALVQRQPGSAFKPLVVYAPAIESGNFQPYSLLKDEEKNYNGYSPRNYDGVYKGEVDMFEAVRKSVNAPAVWLLNEIRVSKGVEFVSKLGIELDKKDNNLAIALGGLTRGTTPLQMAQAYSAFPNNGMMYKAHSIREFIDGEGKKTTAKVDKTKVMSPKTAFYMTELLKGVVDGGTGTAAKMNRPAAGKTGTTQLDLKGLEKNNRDVWFVGYTPEWSAAVWMGFDKTDTKHYVLPSSGSLPAAMFKEVLTKAMSKIPVASFSKPDGVPDLKEPPKTVTNLTAEYQKENKRVLLKWSGEADNEIGAYQVFRKEAKEAEFRQILESVKDVFEVADLSVTSGETYEYYVVPFNTQSSLAGAKSNVVTVAIAADASPSPSGSPGTSPGGSVKPGESVKPTNGSPGKTPKPGASEASGPSSTPSPAGSAKATASPAGSSSPSGGAKPSPSAAAAGVSGAGSEAKPAVEGSAGGVGAGVGGNSTNR
jgi:penicillin-binding protein 2A